MKQRFLDAIYKNIDKNPDDEYLQKQILLLNRAHISTIHSFCLDVIRNNFFELGIPANFRVADTTEISIMKQEVIEDIFEKKYEENNEDFINLLELYTTYKSDDALKEIILNIYEFTRCVPNPEKWLEEKVELLNIKEEDFLNTIWGEMLFSNAKKLINDAISNLEISKKILEDQSELVDCMALVMQDFDDISRINTDTWDNLYKGICDKEFDRWSGKRKFSSEEINKIKNDAKIYRDEAKSLVDSELRNLISCTSKDAIEDIKAMYPILKSIEDLVLDFSTEFERRKREKNIVDFSDIEHLALKLLIDESGKKTKIAEKYNFEEIDVDEYQDINLIQESLLNSVSNGKNIFMVGDVKQSIYRFRQARPDLFLSKYEKYKKDDTEENNLSTDTKIQLYSNFRSRETVINLTNQIFECIMSKELGEMNYDKDEYLNFAGTFDEPKIDCIAELNVIELEDMDGALDETKEKIDTQEIEPDAEDSEDEELLEKSVLEARFTATKIKELVDKGYNYKDISILLRSPSSIAPIYEKELIEQGIPVFSDTASEYLASIEIDTIISILKIIDNPLQDIPLVTVLRSPIFSFSENELMEIRLNKTKVPFFRALQETKTDKVKRFLKLLDEWKKDEKELPLDELIWKIYSQTGYYHYVRLMPNGKLRQANLKKLFEKAKDYEKISFKGVFNFITFIEKISKEKSSIQEAKIIGENDDVVRIMSIHKSKGLEFPIVFLCGVDKQMNLRDLNEKIVLDQDIGIGVNLVKDGLNYSTLSKEAIKMKMRKEAISEEMRVLYVALTRAKEKLIIVGADRKVNTTLEKKKAELEKYKRIAGISPKLVGDYIRYLDWIELVYLYNPRLSLKLDVIDKNSLINLKKEKSEELDEINFNRKVDKEKYKKVDELLNWEYKYKNTVELPSNASVTQLKEENQNKDDKELEQGNDEVQNLFVNNFNNTLESDYFENKHDIEIKGARLGTLIHLALQKISITTKDIEKLIESLKITQEEKNSLRKDKSIFEDYMNSELFEDLKQAKEINKEKPFYMKIPYEGTEENVLVQGVIDLYYVDKDDKLILVDYKTDRNVNEKELIDRYNYQLSLYKEAIEKSLKRKVDKTLIYSTYLGKTIEL